MTLELNERFTIFMGRKKRTKSSPKYYPKHFWPGVKETDQPLMPLGSVNLITSQYLVCSKCAFFFPTDMKDMLEGRSLCCDEKLINSCRFPDCGNAGDELFNFCKDHYQFINSNELKKIIEFYLINGDVKVAREKIFNVISLLQLRSI